MPTNRYYPNVTKTSVMAFLSDLVRFLVNDLAGYTGPGWTIVEGYDSSQSGGSKRQTPNDSSDFDSFPSGFSWRTGSLNTSDWVVLESATGSYGTTLQVYFELDSSSRIKFRVIPLADFSTGGAETSPPSFPATAFGAGSSEVSMDLFSTSARYSVVADEAMFSILGDNGSDPKWIYVGELDGARSEGSPADDRPFVIYDYTDYVYQVTNAYWNRLSPLDDSTILTSGREAILYASEYPHNSGNDDNFLGQYSVWPLGLWFSDSGHKHFAGWLRNIGYTSVSAPSSGTLASKSWMVRGEYVGYSRLCWKWDGTTDYP